MGMTPGRIMGMVMANTEGAGRLAATEDLNSIFQFYREMDQQGRRTFWACTAGWTLDGMDFMLFPLAIGTLVTVFGTDPKTLGGIVSLTVLCSAVGGWLAGFLSDRIGRVRTMQLTILIFSIGSLASAFAQSVEQLTIARAVLGVGFGGRGGCCCCDPFRSGRGQAPRQGDGFLPVQLCGRVGPCSHRAGDLFRDRHSGYCVAHHVCDRGSARIAHIFYPPQRKEPAVAVTARQREPGVSFFHIFDAANIRATLTGSLLTIGAQGGFYALMTWVPQYLRSERKISILASTPYLMALIGGCFIGYIAGGWLSDKFGRRQVFLFFSAAAAASVYVYTHVPLTDAEMLMLGFPLGFFAVGYYSALMACLNEMFVTRVRGAGVGFTYNAGRAVGGLFPYLVGALAASTTLSSAISIFALISYGLVFVVALLFLRETKGTDLSV